MTPLLSKTTAKDRVVGSVAKTTTPQVFSDGAKDVQAVAPTDQFGNLDERVTSLLGEMLAELKAMRTHLELITGEPIGTSDTEDL